MVDQSSPAQSSLKIILDIILLSCLREKQGKAATSLRLAVWGLPLVPGRRQHNWHFCGYVPAQWWLLSYLPRNLGKQSENDPQSMPARRAEEVGIAASLPPGPPAMRSTYSGPYRSCLAPCGHTQLSSRHPAQIVWLRSRNESTKKLCSCTVWGGLKFWAHPPLFFSVFAKHIMVFWSRNSDSPSTRTALFYFGQNWSELKGNYFLLQAQ